MTAKAGLAAYLVLTDDFHASEYVGDYFKAREYLSGFTGSAGTLLILPSRALLWTDGRYFLQAESQLAGSGIELMRSGEPDVPTLERFLLAELEDGSLLGFDARTVNTALARDSGNGQIQFPVLSHKICNIAYIPFPEQVLCMTGNEGTSMLLFPVRLAAE